MFATRCRKLSLLLRVELTRVHAALERHRPTLFACGIGTVVIVVVATVFAANAVGSRTEPRSPGVQSTRLEAEHIVLTRRGFEPSAIRRPVGRFILMVDNRSGLPEIELQLDRENGGRLRQTRIPREKLDWIELVDLEPGEYLLTETGQPSWSCRVTIGSR